MQRISIDLDRESHKPLYIQLSEILIQYANEHHLKDGDLLPSENELLARFKVSRHTIRLAVERLVKLGTVKKVRGQGTFFISKEKKQSVSFNFNSTLESEGITVKNEIIDLKIVNGQVNWLEGLLPTNWDETVWIRRVKSTADELLAVDERLLPGFIVNRYSREEIENENLIIDLMEKHPDTQMDQFSYAFTSQSLSAEESALLKIPRQTRLLRRIGEYFNHIGERFMLSRLTILSDRISLKYEYSRHDDGWIIPG